MNLKKVISIFLIIVLSSVLLSSCSKSKSDIKTTYSLRNLQADFIEFQNIIDNEQAKLYVNKDELSELFKTQYSLLKDGMTKLEFYRVLSPIVSKLNCTHTYLTLNDKIINADKDDFMYVYPEGKYLPLDIKIIENEAFVYQNIEKENIPAGAKIIEINGQPIKEIINVFLNNTNSDGSNTSRKYYFMSNWFSELYFNYINESDKFKVTYVNPFDNKTMKADLEAIIGEKLKDWKKNKDDKNSLYFNTFEKNYAVLTIKTFELNDNDVQKFKNFIREFFIKVSEENISNVILDVRGNWGGNVYCTLDLLSYLLHGEARYFIPLNDEQRKNMPIEFLKPIILYKNNFKGNLYVLTDGGNSSATTQLISILKAHNTGTYIGEETAASFKISASQNDVELLNTKVRFRYSREAAQVDAPGIIAGQGIMPDYRVIPKIQDYIDNKDIVKDFAVDLIMKKN